MTKNVWNLSGNMCARGKKTISICHIIGKMNTSKARNKNHRSCFGFEKNVNEEIFFMCVRKCVVEVYS